LTSSSTSALKVIHIDQVHNISVEGSPFMGPENAPVTLAVFLNGEQVKDRTFENLDRLIEREMAR
jgi:hypothetical protein